MLLAASIQKEESFFKSETNYQLIAVRKRRAQLWQRLIFNYEEAALPRLNYIYTCQGTPHFFTMNLDII